MNLAAPFFFTALRRRVVAALVPAVLMVAALFPVAVQARVFPDEPSGAGETVPDAITPYERRVLRLEYQRLVREISEMRRRARESAPELEPERTALASALEARDAAAAEKAAKALDAAVEAYVAGDPDLSAKIKRLGDVGTLLSKDSSRRKELRSLQHDTAPRKSQTP